MAPTVSVCGRIFEEATSEALQREHDAYDPQAWSARPIRIVRWRPASELPSRRGYYLTRRSVPSNGRAPEDGRRGSSHRQLAKIALVQDPVTPFAAGLRSTRSAAPPRASAGGRSPLG